MEVQAHQEERLVQQAGGKSCLVLRSLSNSITLPIMRQDKNIELYIRDRG